MATAAGIQPAPDEVLAHVVDVHCHPTDSPISQATMDSLRIKICAMFVHLSSQNIERSS